jgi:HD-GYP domain-containing protein (c-di-GMP phosphodiesterase class II)
VLTAEHSRNVGDLCVAAAQGLMSINEGAVLEIAGQLHDIGKLGVPDAILLKPGPLTEAEWQVMQDHERRSIDVIASTFSSSELVEITKYQSHWYDGSKAEDDAQPKGKEIPLGARILHIADAFDAMVSQRPYRPARSYVEAYAELRRCAGTQFDPELVEHFIAVVNARDDTRRKEASEVSNSIKLEIGREVESLLVAVNTAAWNDLALSAGQLAALADQYDLSQVAAVAEEIKAATVENVGQMEIMKLATKLLGVCGPLRKLHDGRAEVQNDTLAA